MNEKATSVLSGKQTNIHMQYILEEKEIASAKEIEFLFVIISKTLFLVLSIILQMIEHRKTMLEFP